MEIAVLVVLAIGSSGLALAIAGWFRPLPAVVLGLAASGALIGLTRRPRHPTPRASHGTDPDGATPGGRGAAAADPGGATSGGQRAAAAVSLALVAATSLFHAAQHGEHLLTDRDPGVYVTTGRWLAAEGDLLVPAAGGPFDRAPAAVLPASDLGFHPLDGDPAADRAPQFTHLFPVLLAWGHWIGGDTGLLAVPALLGGLALASFWSFATRLLSPWVAAAAVAALAVGPLQLFFTRDAYSEPTAQMLLFTGAGLLLAALERGSPRFALGAGVVLGATLHARIDGAVFVVLLPLWLAMVARTPRWRDRPRFRGIVVALAAGALGSMALAALDLVLRSPDYLEELAPELVLLFGGLSTTTILAIATVVVRRVRSRTAAAWRDRGVVPLAAAGAGGMVALAVLGWFVRPAVSTARGDASPFIAAVQAAQGLPVEPTLRYYESSVQWLSWYVGPAAVALGIAGAAAVWWRSIRRFEAGPESLLLTLALAATVLYLWRPSISPDHLWAMRRYHVVTIPALVAFAAWSIERLTTHLAGRAARPPDRGEGSAGEAESRGPGGPAVRGAPVAAALVAAVILAVPATAASWPLRSARPQDGTAGALSSLCERIGGDAAVAVVPEDNLNILAPLAIRSWCGVPVATVGVGSGPEAWSALASEWAQEGRRLVAVARTRSALELIAPGAEVHLVEAVGREAEVTLTHRPRDLVPWTLRLAVAQVPAL